MPTQSATVIVLHPSTREILLHKREDFRVWSLPGGHIETGETWEAAAIRETYEETGYRIRVERLVGEYWRPQLSNGGDLAYVALGCLLEETPGAFGWETVAVAWFPATSLPASLYRFGRVYIADALTDASSPIKRTLFIPWHQALLLRVLLWLRSLRNRLSKQP